MEWLDPKAWLGSKVVYPLALSLFRVLEMLPHKLLFMHTPQIALTWRNGFLHIPHPYERYFFKRKRERGRWAA